MDTRLVVLKLVLDGLGVGSSIANVDERKQIQKAVYLLQSFGVSLGYPYSWYLKGPYSTSLTKDYYSLDEALSSGEEADHRSLNPAILSKVQALAAIKDVPPSVDLKTPEWLELLASYHYLREEAKLDHDRAIKVLAEEKQGLVGYVDQAIRQLQEFKLLD